MFGLQPLVNVVRRARVFKRSKTPLEVKASLLYYALQAYPIGGGLGCWWYIVWAGDRAFAASRVLHPSLRGGLAH